MPRRKKSDRKPTRQVNYVAKRRRLLGMSQAALADAVGVDQTTISSFENRLTWPEAETMWNIAQALQCTSWLELFVDPDDIDLNAKSAPLPKAEKATLADVAESMLRRLHPTE
nr:helix-turn-helix transcriptional regulator [Acuticoccus kalidii]